MTLYLLAAAALTLLAILAYAVTNATTPWPLDTHAANLRGHWQQLAHTLTYSGRTRPLAVLSIATILAAIALHHPLRTPIAIIIAQLLSQGAADGIKRITNRTRPEKFIGRRELGRSFPSGHTTTAMVFYGSWCIVTLQAPIPLAPKIAIATALACWAIGIAWSRLALAAHYLTDIIGGILLGTATTALLFAIL